LNFFSVLCNSFFEMFTTRILSISSVSVLFTRWCKPRQAPSSFWKSSWCMIWLTCSESFLSISAITASIDWTASSDTMAECSRTLAARVLTAFSISSRFFFVLGLNSFFSSDSNSLTSSVAPPA